MKRPQSAKPMRSFVPQVLAQDGINGEPRHFLKTGKRHLTSAVSMSNDLSRLLPKKIHHDKQQLYHQNLQLKTVLNQANQENLKLKTKVALFQRQKDRLHKTDHHGLSNGKSSNNLIAKPEKENGIVTGLKKIVRETRQENQALKAEVNKLKKSIRYTKLNQFEVQRQTIYEENKKLAKLVQHYEVQLTSRVQNDQQVQYLHAELSEKTRTLKQVTSDNIRYQEILQQVEAQYRETSEKLLIQEKKWQRNFAVQKRKFDQLNKHVESLRAEVKTLNQKLQEEKKKNQQRKVVRPASSHPHQNTADAEKNKQLKEKEAAMQVNSRLKSQLQEAKKRLIDSENKLKNTGKNVTNTLQLSKNQTFELNLTKEEQISQNKQQSNNEQEYYGSDFQQNVSKVPKLNSLPVNEKQKNIIKTKTSSVMLQIRKLLTYRLKYNRYTFKQLKADIEVSPDSTFVYQDLLNMLMAEPFYLTSYYAQQFLRVCYGRKDIHNDDELELKNLIKHLRSVIGDFELKQEEEEESMLYKIADNLTRNRKSLEVAFGKIKDKTNGVPQPKLHQVLRQVSKLSEQEIDLAICYVSINTETLQAINFIDFLDRFYINSSQSLSNKHAARLNEDQLSLGEGQNIDESELIADDELV